MQILPLLQSSSGTTAQSGQTTGTQATSFAALLDKYAASGTSGTTTRSSASSSTIGNPLEAANTPNGADLANLKLTKEDIAALRDELLSRGFTTVEIDDMEAGVEGGSGMTWGQMMAKVQKKVASGNSQDQHEIPTGEQAQLLGFFGKLGFTADESQQLVDSLAKGETESVWNAVNAKVSGLSADSTVSLNAAEMASLARNLNLSDSAQSRISALFEQSNASEGLSGEGLRTAMSLVQNELSTKTAQEIQSLSDFRQAASTVLHSAWEKSSSKERSDIHEDDVARKAAQAVAMSAASQDGDVATNEAGQPASQAKLTLLADVPAAGSQTSGHTAQTEASQASAQSPTQTLAQTAGSASPSQALSGTVQVQVSAGQAQNAAPQLSVTAPQVQVLAAQEQAAVSPAPMAAGPMVSATKSQSQAASAPGVSATAGTQQVRSTATLPDNAAVAATVSDKGNGGTASATTTGQVEAAQPIQSAASPSEKDGNGAGGAGKRQSEGALNLGAETNATTSAANREGNEEGGFDLPDTGRASSDRTAMSGATAPTPVSLNAAHTGKASTATTSQPSAYQTPGTVAQQVENTLLQNMGQGSRQITLILQPEELGNLSVTLTVKEKEVRAVIKADSPETSALLQDQVATIRKGLEDQGFKVTKLDVQTGLAQDNPSSRQGGAEQQAQARQQQENFDRLRSSMRNLPGNETTLAEALTTASYVPTNLSSGSGGLDLFA
ncbi:MAG: flagellar hook-length control protein FliK [Desulfovibrionaceae bacterium]